MSAPSWTLQGWTPPHPLPDAVAALLEIAYNFRWTYCPSAWQAFERLDPELWESTQHNPVRLLVRLSADRAAEAAKDPQLVALVHTARAELHRHLHDLGWYGAEGKGTGVALPMNLRPFLAAYFCAEFGIAECFQIYSGGLGLLAGDHLKSATDIGLPLIAVGLLYRNGYFHQALDDHGLQQELYPALDPLTQPVRRVVDGRGEQLRVRVELPGRTCTCAIWRADVGKVRLYLLDTNIDDNSADDREITANLYLGDQRRRIEQEIVLGIGGVRALEALGEQPTVFHMNEGHAAFMALERIRQFRQKFPQLSFDHAREAAAPSHVFTTHTPVPAGIDHFSAALVQQYFAAYHDSLGLDMEGFMALGRENVADRSEAFSMAILAIRTAKWCNGVSRLHGRVSRTMWRNIWPGVPEGDVPIGHVTNGVHAPGWISPTMSALYDKHLPKGWKSRSDDAAMWKAADAIPDRDLWEARNASRARFTRYCESRSLAGASGGCASRLDANLLTIGFARRFAGYKRATLLFRDIDRLEQLMCRGSGFQLVVAGKSHPGDTWGKHLIRDVVEFAREDRFKGRILFLEDYGIDVAREMVRGCDVWLNNPIRGLEASGTSGMKAAMNGVINASILDGWWDEGYAPDAGYKIDDSGIYPNDAPDDDREDAESQALYRLIETQLLPDFYTRDAAGVPARWTARMRACIRTLTPEFNTDRMVKEYALKYYFPAHTFASRLAAGVANGITDMREARELADHIARYRGAWAGVRIKGVETAASGTGDAMNVTAAVRLAGLRPEEVHVEIYHGWTDETGAIPEGRAERMTVKSALGDTTFHFSGIFRAPRPADRAAGNGQRGGDVDQAESYGVCVRVVPGDERLPNPYIPGLITSSPVMAVEAERGANV